MSREKVLIVEDEMDLLDLVDFNLTRRGFVTAGALDGVEAMEKVESFRPDIMVLDLMLPKLDGWEICRRLRQRNREIPVVMLTAKCMPEDRVKGLEAGASDYVTKPFEIKELVIRIENLLGKKREADIRRMLFHEMSNRVSAIGGYTTALSKCGRAIGLGRQADYLMSIRRHVNYTTELISEAGALIEAGSDGTSIAVERCDVASIAARVCESYGQTAADKGIALAFASGEDLPAIEANPFAVKQVLTNLVGNAVKYCGHGCNIEVSVKAAPDGASICVMDDGPGIPREDLCRIFEKGFRARNAPETANGSGLGLYIVKTLLEKMVATITFESVEGEGSVFEVYLKAGPCRHHGR